MHEVPPALVERLLAARRRHVVPARLRPLAREFGPLALGVLFPHFADALSLDEASVREDVLGLAEALERLLRAIASLGEEVPPGLVARFLEALAAVHASLEADALAILEGDPAARSLDEVVLTYPGFYAIAVYRVAHALSRLGLPLLPRLLTEHAHERTGIDLHPGATIGQRFCIDHGTGVVVGETCVIGDGVKLYQGVTLGALTVDKALADEKRHPTIEDEVVIYAGATILGGDTVIGHHSVVAGNAWVTRSVPPHSAVSRRSEVRPRGAPGAADAHDWVI